MPLPSEHHRQLTALLIELFPTRSTSHWLAAPDRKIGHYARECRRKKKIAESNAVTSQTESISEEKWDAEACCATIDPNPQSTSNVVENEVLALHAEEVNYENDWIVDSGCSNHMTRDKRKLQNIIEYKGSRVVVTANNSKLPIAHVGKTMIVPRSNSNQVELDNVFYVPGMKKNLVSIPQLTSAINFVVFGPEKSSYSKLKTIINKFMLKGLPQLDIREDMVCVSCQYGKAHQLQFKESKFRAKQPLELVHSNVFGPVKQSSLGGMRYMVTLIDDFSRTTIVEINQNKKTKFQYGLDYDETLGPVAKFTTIRVLLALATCKDSKLWKMDVKNAFLNEEFDRDICIEQPKGFKDKIHHDYVCKLRIYGLKQVPRAWYGKIAKFLVESSFTVVSADSSLFVKAQDSKVAIILVYMDNLIITGDHIDKARQIKQNLLVRFEMKELGELKHFLGLEMEYSEKGLFLGQQKYVKDLLQKYDMSDCKKISTPMEVNKSSACIKARIL
ncbi:putative mitochondrial protein [Cucumis melo var. makuwa]|uniref:Putative mitochondrial protein n=1 Tax=Cucumis melo var. makuwa TaxID=1194695 RepID=A0A5D3BUX0_CUCMM|nr:putative mitochondrial protein [Cucumis melo var. makuwa]